MQYINAHCHDFIKAPNVVGAIVNATQKSDWERVLKIQSANVYAAIGIHPWYVSNASNNWQQKLTDLLIQNPNALVGETGLDTTHENIDMQMAFFVGHLQIATKLQRGISVHCVHAWDKLLHIFKSEPLPPVILLHGFAGAPEVIRQMPDNVYYSYGHDILNNDKAVKRIAATPTTRILVESDDFSPDILPDLVKKIAEIKNIDISEMADIILQNTQRFLHNGLA